MRPNRGVDGVEGAEGYVVTGYRYTKRLVCAVVRAELPQDKGCRIFRRSILNADALTGGNVERTMKVRTLGWTRFGQKGR